MAMFSKLKQIKDLRDQAKKAQDLFKDISVIGSGAKDKVMVTMDGNLQVQGVTVDPELLNADGKSKLESGIKDAFSDAVKKAQREMASKMKSSGMNFPGLS